MIVCDGADARVLQYQFGAEGATCCDTFEGFSFAMV